MKQYDKRDAAALDRAGGYYMRHVEAMTTEGLYDKSAIAAELAWRDQQIDTLQSDLAKKVRDALERDLHQDADHEALLDNLRLVLDLPGADAQALVVVVTELVSERDEARAGYSKLDENWSRYHEVCLDFVRNAAGVGADATVPEICKAIHDRSKS